MRFKFKFQVLGMFSGYAGRSSRPILATLPVSYGRLSLFSQKKTGTGIVMKDEF